MTRPAHVVFAARVALLAGSITLVVLALGPFSGAERHLGFNDKTAHALAFAILMAVAFLAFPRSRRSDLAVAAIVLGGAIEVAQAFDHRTASLGDWLADAVGVYGVYAVSMIESVRRMTREQGQTAFSDITAMDRRRDRRGREVAFEPAGGAIGALSFAERASRRFPTR